MIKKELKYFLLNITSKILNKIKRLQHTLKKNAKKRKKYTWYSPKAIKDKQTNKLVTEVYTVGTQ